MDSLFSIENFDDGKVSRDISSPRTLEACLQSGIDPSELKRKPREKFVSSKLNDEMIVKKFNSYERKRLNKIDIVTEARREIMELANKKHGTGDGAANLVAMMAAQAAEQSSSAMAAEIARMEALKRRQEKEIEKMVEKEKQVAELQLKIKKQEDDAMKKERDRLKKVAEAKIQAQKKQIKFLQEKAEKEKEDNIKRREMLRKEEEFAKKREKEHQIELRRIAAEAKEHEAERAAKLEANRLKTEALLESHFQAAERNRLLMLEKEAKVRKQLEEKKIELAKNIADKKAAAEIRIREAMEKHHELHEQKKKDFEQREAEAMKRYKLKEIEDREILKKQAQAREKKNTMRITRLIDAYKNRSDHRQTIVDRRQEKDKVYGVVQDQRSRELDMKKFESNLKKQEKQENIERTARMQEFHRLQTLQKIYTEDSNYSMIKAQKAELLAKHRAEVKDSLNRKHEIANAMEQMKITNDFTLLQKVFEKQKKANASKNRAHTTQGGEGNDIGEVEEGDARLNQTH